LCQALSSTIVEDHPRSKHMRISRKLLAASFVPFFLFGILPAYVLQAQDVNKTTITLAVQGFQRDILTPVVEAFEAANPDIDVVLVELAPNQGGNVNDNDALATYLDGVQERITQADVIPVSTQNLLPEATRAGYFLDMMPLARADTTLNTDDFYPALWESFQWEGGQWALPTGGSVAGLVYQPEAFDAVGLMYPDAFWTLDDIANAARVLSEYDTDGVTITKNGFVAVGGAGTLLLTLANNRLYDDSQLTLTPNFTGAGLDTYLDAWVALTEEGLTTPVDGTEIGSTALVLGATQQALNSSDTAQLVPLPGGSYAVDANGIAISAGTQNPEAAYRLATYLVSDSAAVAAFFNTVPARRSLVGATNTNAGPGGGGPGGGGFFGGNAVAREQMAIAMEQAQPATARLFGARLNAAINAMQNDGLDAATALQDAQIAAQDGLALADARRGTVDVTVIEPTPPPDVAAGEIVLKFATIGLPTPLPNEADWETLAADFAANDSEVGRVDFVSLRPQDGLEEVVAQADCFYWNGNLVPSADLSLLLSIDPLMAGDFNFNRDDFVTSVLEQMRRDDMTWGMPIVILPQTLYYSPDVFNQAGALMPFNGWTVADFENALRTIKTDPSQRAPYESRGFDGTYLLTLIAAYGGLPLDYRTTPVSVSYNDPASVQAIQQVLELVKAGYVDYTSLVNRTGGGFFVNTGANDTEEPLAMYSRQLLGGFGGRAFGGPGGAANNTDEGYVPVLFPQGTTYNGVAVGVGAAYISAQTQYAEACYRFISAVAQQPGLITGMPARRSLINAQETVLSEGQATVDFYNALDALLGQATTVAFPITTGANANAISQQLVETWLYMVFDDYLADESGSFDLQVALDEADLYAEAYLECVAQLPPADGGDTGGIRGRILEYAGCAVKVDPDMAAQFPQLN
jgi:ABC-type glycerol-3-phosphate transport system substrate-binding protein